jgi:hypothetical protein
MRLAGIDGVIVDWYGTADYLDHTSDHRSTSAMYEHVFRAGLKFAICYEDQTVPKLVVAGRRRAVDRVKHATAEIDWLSGNSFHSSTYLRLQ